MNSQPTPNQPEIDRQAQKAEHRRQILDRTIDRADQIAGFVHEQAAAQAEALRAGNPPAKPVDFTKPFDRIARCIRRTIFLVEKLETPPQAPKTPNNAVGRHAARKQIIRAIENAIDRDAEPAEAQEIHAEFLERLDAPDLDDDIAQRPIEDIIADITDDLGLETWARQTPRRRRTPRDIEILEARAQGLRVDAPNAPIFPKSTFPKLKSNPSPLRAATGPPAPSAEQCLALLDRLAKA